MKLSRQDAEIFFKLMWSLLAYANRKLRILHKEVKAGKFATLPYEQIIEVREALFDHVEFIDAFVQENPDDLTTEELEILKSWKQFIRGDFFIERLLKKYAIFIGGEAVYGVLGLHNSLEEVIPYDEFPYYVRAVLLPFKGKIVYDGLLQGYDLSFGGGIKSSLRQIYMAAKQNGMIIESLDSPEVGTKPSVIERAVKDWREEIAAITQEVNRLRASAGSPAIHAPAFGLAKASIEFASTAVHKPYDLDELWKALKRVDRQLKKAATTLNRAGYVRQR